MALSYRAAQNLIKRGDEEGLRLALDQKLNPNLTNENGWSLLMLAAVEGSVPLGQLLLERNANKMLQNKKGDTALSIATHRGYTLFAELLNSAIQQ